MATTADPDTESSIRRSWIVLFLLVALGLGAAAVLYVGGSLVAGSVVLF